MIMASAKVTWAKQSKAPAAEQRGLRQYFNEDWTTCADVHPFMSEVARLALYRGFSQESLAKRYGEVTGAKVCGGNISRHFRSAKPQEKVINAYRKILQLSDNHVQLLLGKRPDFSDRISSVADLLDATLCPEEIAPLFQAGAIDRAISLMCNDERLALECVDEAQLWYERYEAFDLSPVVLTKQFGIPLPEPQYDFVDELRTEFGSSGDDNIAKLLTRLYGDPWEQIGIRKRSLAQWFAVMHILRDRDKLDLSQMWGGKSIERLAVERTLLEVWNAANAVLDWHEWAAVQSILEGALYRRNHSVADAKEILDRDLEFLDWAGEARRKLRPL